MIQCALTGGIGAGKTVVSKVFSLFGAAIFNADEVAKSLYVKPELISRISLEFGPSCLKQGQVDFRALADIVFKDQVALKKLNSIVHPLLMAEYEIWLKQQSPEKVCILESAIIFEAGLEQHFEKIICVYAPEQLCVDRIMKRDGVTEEKARARMNAQMDPKIKMERSAFVIVNDDEQPVLPQVLNLYDQLTSIAS